MQRTFQIVRKVSDQKLNDIHVLIKKHLRNDCGWLLAHFIMSTKIKKKKKTMIHIIALTDFILNKTLLLMTKLLLNFTSKTIEKYDGVTTGRSLWLPLPVMYVIHVMEQTNHRQDICLPKTSFSVGIPYMYENVEETVVLHVRMYVRNRKYDNLIFLSWR